METENLAWRPDWSATARSLAEEVEARRDSEALRMQALDSQRSRHFLNSATEAGAGAGEARDFDPHRDVTNDYVRNHMDWTAAVARYRFPPLNDAFEAE
ncbi:MAG: hypothetical protein OXH76_09970 [Boseongicola sp.]|nr:hypothetical protein [Boseongicola sp.]